MSCLFADTPQDANTGLLATLTRGGASGRPRARGGGTRGRGRGRGAPVTAPPTSAPAPANDGLDDLDALIGSMGNANDEVPVDDLDAFLSDIDDFDGRLVASSPCAFSTRSSACTNQSCTDARRTDACRTHTNGTDAQRRGPTDLRQAAVSATATARAVAGGGARAQNDASAEADQRAGNGAARGWRSLPTSAAGQRVC